MDADEVDAFLVKYWSLAENPIDYYSSDDNRLIEVFSACYELCESLRGKVDPFEEYEDLPACESICSLLLEMMKYRYDNAYVRQLEIRVKGDVDDVLNMISNLGLKTEKAMEFDIKPILEQVHKCTFESPPDTQIKQWMIQLRD